MITFFPPTVVGGTVLVIERIESSNYVTNVSGWMIAADGSAEFFNILIRGSFVTGPPGSRHIEIRDSPGNVIEFYTGAANEADPGVIDVNYDIGTDSATLRLASSELIGAAVAQLALTSDASSGDSLAIIDALLTQVTGAFSAQGAISFGSFPKTATIATLSGTWTASGRGPWHNLGVDGMVNLGGRATTGVLASQIFVLPAGRRPVEQLQFACNANGAYGSIRIDVSGAVVLTAGSISQVSLSGINFPIF